MSIKLVISSSKTIHIDYEFLVTNDIWCGDYSCQDFIRIYNVENFLKNNKDYKFCKTCEKVYKGYWEHEKRIAVNKLKELEEIERLL